MKRRKSVKGVVVKAPRTFGEYVLTLDPGQDPLVSLQYAGALYSQGLYVGGLHDRFVTTDPRQWVLVLGPSQTGKTTGVFIPAVMMHNGPVVSTSTKPDVLDATFQVRRRLGTCWVFDPSGTVPLPDGAVRLSWSPVTAAHDWDGFMAMSNAMVESADPGKGVTDATHWTERADALLSSLLYLAWATNQKMRDVQSWVLNRTDHEKDVAEGLEALAKESPDAEMASWVFNSINDGEQREKKHIYSALAGVLKAYRSVGALDATDEPNFDPRHFVKGRDTVYVVGAAHLQALYAPLVVGLVDSIRQVNYAFFHEVDRLGQRALPVFYALDEAANIAPLPMLPAMASEGGGQGAVGAVGLQDLSQARIRWGAAADGFLSLFPAKVAFRGIGDLKTLDSLSTMTGEHDRSVQTRTTTRPGLQKGRWTRDGNSEGVAWSTVRERKLSPAAISEGHEGWALYVSRNGPVWVQLTPWFNSEPFRTVYDFCALGPPSLPALDLPS